MRPTRCSTAALCSCLICLLLLATACRGRAPSGSEVLIDSNLYYAVLLSNNSVYFGKLEGLNSDYPTLRDVYYVQSVANPETRAASNILVKRGKEWHGPDRMIINRTSIVFVEPVGSGSKVAQLIAESKR